MHLFIVVAMNGKDGSALTPALGDGTRGEVGGGGLGGGAGAGRGVVVLTIWSAALKVKVVVPVRASVAAICVAEDMRFCDPVTDYEQPAMLSALA